MNIIRCWEDRKDQGWIAVAKWSDENLWPAVYGWVWSQAEGTSSMIHQLRNEALIAACVIAMVTAGAAALHAFGVF
jgi:hypothetical protein